MSRNPLTSRGFEMTNLIDRVALLDDMDRVYRGMEADMLAADNAAYLRGYKAALWTVREAAAVRLPSPDAELLEAVRLFLAYDSEDTSDVQTMLAYADALAAAKAAYAKATGGEA